MSYPNQHPRRRASQSSGYYTQSSYGRSSVGGGGAGTYATGSYVDGGGGTYATESHAGGTYYTDPSYRDDYGDEYGDMYGEDDASNYSSGSMDRTQGYYDTVTDPRTMITGDNSVGSRFNASRAHNSISRRGDDVMSQHSFRSTSSRSALPRESEVSSNIQTDNYSIAGTSVGATTVADGGRGRCPYQIEFSVTSTGKQMTSSKRIIHFRFGFANSKALVQGKAGVDCRGVEHDVVVTWSITGGKRSISVDGREIHFEAGKRGQSNTNPSRRADILEAAWQMPEEHVCQLICYAYKPAMGSPEKRNKKWRQYNLTIDGRSFFELPQIFDLGLKGLVNVKGADPLPPMMIEAKDGFGNMSSDLTPPNQMKPRDERRLKSEIKHRIQVQRNLLESRNKTMDVNRVRLARCGDAASVASVSTLGSANSAYTTDSNLIYMTENLTVSDGHHVVSNPPSELNEARQRQAQEQQQGFQGASDSQFFSQTSQVQYVPQVRPSADTASQGYSVSQQQQQQQPLPSRHVGNMYQYPPQPVNATSTSAHSQHLMSQCSGGITAVSNQGQIAQEQYTNNPNLFVPTQRPVFQNSGSNTAVLIQGQVRQQYQQQQQSNNPNRLVRPNQQVTNIGLSDVVAHPAQLGKEQQLGLPVTHPRQHTSQAELASPQTTQHAVNANQNPPRSTSSSLGSTRPPTMDDIRDSMNSSKNRFGFY
ncbi:hypothetical protein HJC23_012979 [Cyclotella cryptica]|uniref:Uncharacterized protein n=1 Tax=Cyclotella cryptica TaxID=29204 RepID=A0ABD3QFR5_9STRA|eukprot:CCRYP_005578-RA/>CCRYP_005578-RA protein AED:0.33 eAED:0.33 QI:0/-1/0/1/-1/1/1/0/703